MSAQVQLDFFQETTREDVLKAELDALKESHDKVRKRLFAQVGALSKMVINQQEEIACLRVHVGLNCVVESK